MWQKNERGRESFGVGQPKQSAVFDLQVRDLDSTASTLCGKEEQCKTLVGQDSAENSEQPPYRPLGNPKDGLTKDHSPSSGVVIDLDEFYDQRMTHFREKVFSVTNQHNLPVDEDFPKLLPPSLDVSRIKIQSKDHRKLIQVLSRKHEIHSYFKFGLTLQICLATQLEEGRKPAIDYQKTPTSSLPRENDWEDANNHRPVLKHALRLPTLAPVVVKIISRKRLPGGIHGENNWKQLLTKLMNLPPHPNIAETREVFLDDKSYFMSYDMLLGAELFDFLTVAPHVPERVCKYIIRQVLLSLHHLHQHGILHRDVKPENLIFKHPRHQCKSEEELYALALIDFDTTKPFSRNLQTNSRSRSNIVGTYGYIAPEILRGYAATPASDLWSVGVLFYLLMTGSPPIEMAKVQGASESIREFENMEHNGGVDFEKVQFDRFPGARSLCNQLLRFNVGERISSASSALRHPWLSENASLLKAPLAFSVGPFHEEVQKNRAVESQKVVHDLLLEQLKKSQRFSQILERSNVGSLKDRRSTNQTSSSDQSSFSTFFPNNTVSSNSLPDFLLADLQQVCPSPKKFTNDHKTVHPKNDTVFNWLRRALAKKRKN